MIRSLPYDTLIEVDARQSVIQDPSSISVVEEEAGQYSIPRSTDLLVKIKDIKSTSDRLFLKVIALSKPIMQDITTKEGSTVKKTELIVGDETGEIRLNGWRELAELLNSINPGQRLFLRGVAYQTGRNGAPYLTLKPYTALEKPPA